MFYTIFYDIDSDGSNFVACSELLHYFEIEDTKFEHKLFGLFDEDASGEINFMEFVCSMWNMLTLHITELGSLVFLMFSPDGRRPLTYSEIREIMEMMVS